MLREPAAAGQFYPGLRRELTEELQTLMPCKSGKLRFRGALVPHAGYMFSGRTAGAVYSKLSLPPAVIILGPNHTGRGSRAAVWAEGAWRTPVGDVEIDSALAKRIIGNSSLLEEDYEAHIFEHSIEVQLPFLKYLRGDLKFAPLALAGLSFAECGLISEALVETARGCAQPPAILASSDMSHYEPEKTARAKDGKAVEAMLAMDEDELYRTVRDENISMCGYIPAVIMLMAVKALGADKAELVEYSTSSRATGDESSVVGYCGMVFR
jgi:MEMO1 family protein